MASATIAISDNPDGTIMVSADFGDAVDQGSRAHHEAIALLEAMLRDAKTYTKIEDTVPEVDVEPSSTHPTTRSEAPNNESEE